MQTSYYKYKWFALVGLSLLSFTAFLDYTIVTTALPFIQKDLNASVLELQWVMNIFSMILCMSMIMVGHLGDRLGRTKVFYFGFIIFAIAAFGAGTADNIQWLIFFRAIQGFAAAIIFTLGVALLPQVFPPHEQTRAIGIFSAFNGVGLASGPFLAGVLISLLNWRWVFWINVPIIVTGIILCSFSLKPAPPIAHKGKIDWLGLILLVIGLGCTIYGIISAGQSGWNSVITEMNLSVGILALLLLMLVESRTEHPLLDVTIFKNPHANLAILICIIAGLITAVFMFFDPLYLKVIRNQDAFIVGVTLLSVPIIQVVISLVLGRLVDTLGIFNLIISGLGVAILSALCHAFFTPTISIYFVILGLMFMGYTWGLANAGSVTAIHESLPFEKLGSSIGTIFTFWNLSGSIFLALSTVIFNWRETMTLNNELSAANVHLTAAQQQDVSLLLSNPDMAADILAKFDGTNLSHISQAFYSSFMSGFHVVAWCSALVMLIVFLLSLKLR